MNKVKKYEICWLQICPFNVESKYDSKRIYIPDRENYPYRLCVLDKNKKVAVDVLLKKSYTYIETSLMYFLGNEASKIEKDKRYACMKLANHMLPCSNDDCIKAIQVLNDMKNGFEYEDGNGISNSEYLEIINDDQQKIKTKRK